MSNSAHMWASLDNKIPLFKDCEAHAGVHSTYYLLKSLLIQLSISTSHLFDVIIGFNGISVLPRAVLPCIVTFLSKIFITSEDILTSFQTSFAGNTRVGVLTGINILYRHEGYIKSCILVYSNFNMRIWGLDPRCPNPDCSRNPCNVKFIDRRGARGDGNHDFVKCKCLECGFKTGWIGRPDWLLVLPQRFWFMHDFPLLNEHRDVIVAQMKK